MYVVRDIFHLKFGHFRQAKALLNDAMLSRMLPSAEAHRALSDFTGESYRLIFEVSFKSLADYEQSLESSMVKDEWQQWYQDFKQHVDHSYREILKQVT